MGTAKNFSGAFRRLLRSVSWLAWAVFALIVTPLIGRCGTILDLPSNSCGSVTGAVAGCNLTTSTGGSSGLINIGTQTGTGEWAVWDVGGSLTDPSSYLCEFQFPGTGIATQVNWNCGGGFTAVVSGGQQVGTGSFGGVSGFVSSNEELTIFTAPSSASCGGQGGCDVFAGAVTGNFTVTDTPEPSTLVLIGSGLLAFGSVRRRRRKSG